MMRAIVLAALAVLAGGAVSGPGEFADRGVLLLTFDDPNYDRWVKYIPLFEKYGAHVSFFPYGPLEGSALEKMAALHRAGHTVGTHTLDHVNVPDYLKEHDEETFWRTQIVPHIRSYARVGIEVQSFAYPNGRRTKETDEMLLRRGIRHIRGCGDGIHRVTFYDRDGTRAAEWKPIVGNDWAYNRMEDLANSRVFFGATVGEAYHSDIDDLCAAVRRAARENKVLQLTSHDIAPDAKHINMKAEWLERILATAKEEGVRMIGYDELPSGPAGRAPLAANEDGRSDVRQRSIIDPLRVVAVSEGLAGPETLCRPRFGQVSEGEFGKGSGPVLKPGEWIVLDYGRELHGSLQIGAGTAGGRKAKARVRFGESVSEAMSELAERGAGNDHAIRDSVIDLPFFGRREIGETGFRFVRIDNAGAKPLQLEYVRAISLMRPMRQIGWFRSSDARLNAVFDTAVRTVRLCCQDYIWDGIKRDRLVWMGDMHPETMAVMAVFGADPIVPQTLEYVAATTGPEKWANGFPTYTLWWLRVMAAWYRFTGDRTFLLRNADVIERTFEHVLSALGPDGWSVKGEYSAFLDWPTHGNAAAERAGTQALALMAARDVMQLAQGLENGRLREKAVEMAGRLEKVRSEPEAVKSAAALQVLSGLVDPQTAYGSVLGRDGYSGVSTFYGYYILEAISAAGRSQRALDTVRDYWGGMLDMGATSFWEDFDLSWTNGCARIDELPKHGQRDIHGDFGNYCYKGFRHSLCHGWSSGPAAWCLHHVLGIRPTEVGCRAVEVRPELGDLDWAEGALALPDGRSVYVSARRRPDGTVETEVDAPDGIDVMKCSHGGESDPVVTNVVGLAASDGWKIVNFQDKLKIAFDGKTLSVSGDKKGDTAWSVTSRALPIAAGTKEIMVGAEIRSTRGMRNQNAAADHTCKIVWLGADGRTVGQSPLRLPCPSSTRPVGVADVIPVADGASAFSIQLGFDRPDLSADDSLVFSDMVYACYPQAGIAKTRLDIPDLHVPTVEAIGPGRFRIADGSGIVPSSVRISVDGRDASCTGPDGDVWTVGDGMWSEGLHVAEIAVSNRIGNATVERRAFYVGKVPDVEKVTLRDDGMTLVGGKPFFPIGAYHVRRHSCNGKDLDRAFDELKSMGFNFAHTYDKVDSGEFLDTAARHGFRLFVLSRDEETNATFLARTRFHPSVLAWYLADDTSDNTTPERLRFLDSVARALDPSRLTCQADGTFFRGLEKAGFSRYSNYVTGSDVFMPEIYPVRNDTKTDTHKTCVATVRRDMRLVKHDIATRADGKPKAIWPILQAFSGWERWNEFPTSRELYATTFAALAEGAQGMTWYTYCGSGKNVGFARTPELVARMKAVSQRIAELSPVLVERSAEGLEVDVLNGPKADPLGHPPVVALLKRHGDSCWIIAVNSSPEQVSARFALPSAKDAAVAKVRWEDRTVSAADGMFSDSFDGFGVHVYEIPAGFSGGGDR